MPILRLALPKGRMQDGVLVLLADAGIRVRSSARSYRPELSLPGFEAKLLKPQNVVGMLQAGSRDLGFAGADWVAEQEADLALLLETGLDPVRLVAAAPEPILEDHALPQRPLVVASEYARLAHAWIRRRGQGDRFLHSHGATEVFPPEDADCILDLVATGATLRANGLVLVDELMTSCTGLYAHRRMLEDPDRRERIDSFVLLLRSVLEARSRVLLELNVSADRLDAVVAILPCMRQPTIAKLGGAKLGSDGGYAVRVAVPRGELPRLIPLVKAKGGTDLVVTTPSQIVP